MLSRVGACVLASSMNLLTSYLHISSGDDPSIYELTLSEHKVETSLRKATRKCRNTKLFTFGSLRHCLAIAVWLPHAIILPSGFRLVLWYSYLHY